MTDDTVQTPDPMRSEYGEHTSKLIAERDDLRKKLQDSEAHVAMLQRRANEVPKKANKVGQIVQIDPDKDDNGLGACLLVVEEIRGWGVKGYVHEPKQRGVFHFNVNHGCYIVTGGMVTWKP